MSLDYVGWYHLIKKSDPHNSESLRRQRRLYSYNSKHASKSQAKGTGGGER